MNFWCIAKAINTKATVVTPFLRFSVENMFFRFKVCTYGFKANEQVCQMKIYKVYKRHTISVLAAFIRLSSVHITSVFL